MSSVVLHVDAHIPGLVAGSGRCSISQRIAGVTAHHSVVILELLIGSWQLALFLIISLCLLFISSSSSTLKLHSHKGLSIFF